MASWVGCCVNDFVVDRNYLFWIRIYRYRTYQKVIEPDKFQIRHMKIKIKFWKLNDMHQMTFMKGAVKFVYNLRTNHNQSDYPPRVKLLWNLMNINLFFFRNVGSELQQRSCKTKKPVFLPMYFFVPVHYYGKTELEFLNFKGAQESIPRSRFRQPMQTGGPVRQPYSYSVPKPHRLS